MSVSGDTEAALGALERMRTAIRQEYGDGHEGSFAASCRNDYETVRAALSVSGVQRAEEPTKPAVRADALARVDQALQACSEFATVGLRLELREAVRAALAARPAPPMEPERKRRDYRAMAEEFVQVIEKFRGDRRGCMNQLIVDPDDIREALIKLRLVREAPPLEGKPDGGRE